MANAVSDNVGRLVNISCRATGIPDPDVRWIYNGKVKSSGARTAELIFGKVGKEDTYVKQITPLAGQKNCCTLKSTVSTSCNWLRFIVFYLL